MHLETWLWKSIQHTLGIMVEPCSLPVLLEIARNACNKKGIQLVALLIEYHYVEAIWFEGRFVTVIRWKYFTPTLINYEVMRSHLRVNCEGPWCTNRRSWTCQLVRSVWEVTLQKEFYEVFSLEQSVEDSSESY